MANSIDTRRVSIIQGMIDESEARIADFEEKLTFERKFLEGLKQRIAPLDPFGLAKSENGVTHGPVKYTPRKAAKGETAMSSLSKRIIKLFQDTKTPLRASVISRTLESQGVTSKSPRGLLPNVITVLRRRKKLFRKLERGVYELIEKPVQEKKPGTAGNAS
jgi:hypothetical protein